ncbi:MAG: flagellar hook assembly protein FlgD [Gammaproteobacteria bacterium]|nr:flagellar hook assembly protein FlgD [Gammaproteobacteria bacterium]MCW9004566.1 flagellar hook assembly protein FlgD [Gammaproteobacteria bacterium]MCW9055949.1 flagellar hook assembly protein FlgD [Gammaproteobacteria bacterium]
MEVDSTNALGLRSYRDAAADAVNDKSSLGQDAFLKLMTTQLSNQDPFEPMDNGDFLAQMAQFGTVNGVNELLTSFQSMAASLQSSQALEASNLIGRNVLIQHDEAYLEPGGSIDSAVELNSSAENVVVNIYDANDSLVNRVDLGAQSKGLLQFNWDGTTLNDQRASAGTYRIEVEASRHGEAESITPLVSAHVTSLTLGGVGKEMQVELEHLGQIGFSQVVKIL